MSAEVLNIPVPEHLLHVWNRLFVPVTQPFYLPEHWQALNWAAPLSALPLWKRDELHPYHLPMHVRDTLNLYDLAPEATWAALLDEQGFGALPRETQAGLLEAQRTLKRGGVQRDPQAQPFVWWPQTWRAQPPKTRWRYLKAFVEEDRLPCRRRELTAAHRAALRQHFPALAPLLGTFAVGSGPNCLGTVMAACGASGARELWMHVPPFLRWLEGATMPTNDLSVPGTVLVWRDAANEVQHAALSLGDGWLFHKEAQGWFAPRQVVQLTDALKRWQHGGWSVSGYVLS